MSAFYQSGIHWSMVGPVGSPTCLSDALTHVFHKMSTLSNLTYKRDLYGH